DDDGARNRDRAAGTEVHEQGKEGREEGGEERTHGLRPSGHRPSPLSSLPHSTHCRNISGRRRTYIRSQVSAVFLTMAPALSAASDQVTSLPSGSAVESERTMTSKLHTRAAIAEA